MERERNLPSFKAISSKLQTIVAIRGVPYISVHNYSGNLEELLVLMVRASLLKFDCLT